MCNPQKVSHPGTTSASSSANISSHPLSGTWEPRDTGMQGLWTQGGRNKGVQRLRTQGCRDARMEDTGMQGHRDAGIQGCRDQAHRDTGTQRSRTQGHMERGHRDHGHRDGSRSRDEVPHMVFQLKQQKSHRQLCQCDRDMSWPEQEPRGIKDRGPK